MKNKIITAILIAFQVVLGVAGCSNKTINNPVAKIELSKNPNQMVYNIGEEFSPVGGEITVHFTDENEEPEIIPLTDDRLELSKVDTSRAGSKAVRIIYSMRRTQFVITVNPYVVTFDLGGKGEIAPIELKKAGQISNMPIDPVAEGFAFDGWYLDQAYTQEFNPKSIIDHNITLYARWLSLEVVYYNVRFDYNYGVGSPLARRQQVESGTTVPKPADPTRRGFAFDGWCVDKQGTQLFDFETPILEDIRIYARWILTTITVEEYIFEAECVDLDELHGVGYSSNNDGEMMIQEFYDEELGASNGFAVGYAYKPGLKFDFAFVANKEVHDAKIVARLSAEFKDHYLYPDMFVISLNDEEINYGEIVIDEVPNAAVGKFRDFEILVNATLHEGENVVSMLVNNNDPIIGSLTEATAPIIDCVKITTSAVLWWNGELDLPKAYV